MGTLGTAHAKFDDLAKRFSPTSNPEKWALYQGLSELAFDLQRRLEQIEGQLGMIERRLP